MKRSRPVGRSLTGSRRGLTEGNQRGAMLWDLAGANPAIITSAMVARADASGDPIAHEVLLDTVEPLSVWLSNSIDLLEPDVIVVGGGVATMLRPFFETMQQQILTCA